MAGRKVHFHTLGLEIKKDTFLRLNGKEREVIFVGTLGRNISTTSVSVKQDKDKLQIEYQGEAQLTVKHTSRDPGSHRYDFYWNLIKGKELSDDFDMRGSHWYGVSQVIKDILAYY